MRQVLPISTVGSPSNTTTNYSSVFGSRGTSTSWSATEANINDVSEVAGTISQLTIWIESRGGWTGGSCTFTLRVNGADTALTATMNVGDKITIDKTNSVSISVGDIISLKSAPGASMTASQKPIITAVFTGTSAGQSVYGGGTNSALNNTGTRQYTALHGGGALGTTQSSAATTVASVAGTIKSFKIILLTAPGAGTTREFSIYQNGSQVAASVASISGTNTSVELTGLSISVAAGDLLQFSHVKTAGTPAASVHTYWGIRFDPTTDGESQISGHASNSGTAGQASYNPFGYSNSSWSSGTQAELNKKLVMPLACTLSKFYVASPFAAPGGTASHTETIRINGTSSTLTCAITGAAQAANDSTHSEVIDALDCIGMKHVRDTLAADSNIAYSIKVVIAADPTVTTGRCAQPIINGSVSQVAFNDVGYLPLMGSNGVSNSLDTIDNVYNIVPSGYSGVINNLRILLDGAPATGTFTATLYKNGVATSLTVAITSGTTGSDTTNSVSVTGLDKLAMEFKTTGGASNIAPKGYSVQMTGDNAGEFVLMGTSSDASAPWGARAYYRPTSPGIASTNVLSQDVVPLYCKIKAWTVDIPVASASDVNTMAIYKNTVQLSSTAFTIAAGSTLGSVTGLSIQLYPGDLLSLSGFSDTFDTVDAHQLHSGILFTADTNGESWFGSGTTDDLDTTGTTEYAQPQVGNVVWRNTERPVLTAVACTLRDMRILVVGSTGAGYGKSWTFLTRVNGADTGGTVKMEDESFMNDDPDTTNSLSAGDYFILKETNTGTPAAQDSTWAWVVYTTPVALANLRLLSSLGVGT